MRAADPRFIRLHLSSPPQIFCAHVLFFRLRGAAGFQRRRDETFSSSSAPSSGHASASQWRHHDEESKGVKVAVWWDFENCNIPNGVNVFRAPHRITSALRSHGIRGPVSITAFGDVSQLSRSTQDALHTCGVCLNHVPSCGKNSSDRSLLTDLIYWVAQNPPPVHFFLISGDRDFANILHRLRMNNYNILLACTDGASGALCSAATVMWQWNTLVRGENLTGRYFNHPPDGLQGSWYGHYRGTLDNPFTVSEEATSLQPEESVEPTADAKPRSIPRPLVHRIRQILYSYPEGISLPDLRAELKKNSVALDKDYFGHKKFSHLLLSMPNVLSLKFKTGDAQPLVYGVHQRMMDQLDPSSKPATGIRSGTGDKEQSRAAENDVNEKPSLLTPQPDAEKPCQKVGMLTDSKHTNVDTAWTEQATLIEEAKTATKHNHDNAGTSWKEEPINTEGLIGRIWKILIGGRSASNEESISMSQTGSNPCPTAHTDASTSVESCPNSERMGSKEETIELKTRFSGVSSSNLLSGKCATDKMENKVEVFQNQPVSSKNSSRVSQSAPCETNAETAVRLNDACRNSSFFSRVFTWCRFWKTNCKDHDTVSQRNQSDASEFPRESVEGRRLDLPAVSGTKVEPHDLFSMTHFWDSMESFLHTSKGSDLISKARTREELMCGLQNDGPLVLSALKESHLRHLVNLLIIKKKWLKECASEANPFKLTFPVKRVCIPSYANGVNGLRSIFSNRISHSNSVFLSKQDIGNRNHQPNGSSYNGSVDAKVPKDISDLKAWFQKTCNSNRFISSKEFEKHFVGAFDRKLDYSSYGYFSTDDLIAAFTTDADDHLKSKKIPREVTLSHCRTLLVDFLKHNPQGFNIGLFRPVFFRRYGYALDYQTLGYPKLASLLQIMPGVRIESSIVLPAAMFHPESKREKGVADEVSTHNLENNKARENSTDSEDPINDGDHEWDELGPVSGVEKSKRGMEEKVESSESVVAEEEFSDPEEYPTVPYGTNKQACNRDNISSAFLEVLDSYYGKQGTGGIEEDEGQDSRDGSEEDKIQVNKGGVNICQAQAVDGLVECSRKRDVKPTESKPVDSMPQLKTRKSFSFVCE